MGVASNSTAKPLNVTAKKPQVMKLIEIKFDRRDEAAIKSRVEKVSNVSDENK